MTKYGDLFSLLEIAKISSDAETKHTSSFSGSVFREYPQAVLAVVLSVKNYILLLMLCE